MKTRDELERLFNLSKSQGPGQCLKCGALIESLTDYQTQSQYPAHHICLPQDSDHDSWVATEIPDIEPFPNPVKDSELLILKDLVDRLVKWGVK